MYYPFFWGTGEGNQEEVVDITKIRLYIWRFLKVDVSGFPAEELLSRYEEAKIIREFEVGVMAEAINRAFGGK